MVNLIPLPDPLTHTDTVLGRLVLVFLADCADRPLAPDTLRFYRFTLGGFCKWLARAQLPQDPALLTPEHFQAFKAYLRTPNRDGTYRTVRPASASTVRSYLVALRAFCNWCVAEGWLSGNPLTGPNLRRPKVALPKVPEPDIHPFTPDELARLLAACDRRVILGARDEAYLRASVAMLVRVGDLCRLRLTDYDAASGEWRLRMGKTGRWVQGQLRGRARRSMTHWLINFRPLVAPDLDTVFVGLSDKGPTQLTPSGAHQLLERLAARVGLTGRRVSPHDLRHTGAVAYLARTNGDVASLRLLMGHTTLATTLLYLRFSQQQLAARREAGAVEEYADEGAVERYRRAGRK